MYQSKSGVKNFSLYWDRVPPPPPPPKKKKNLRPGTPPPPKKKSETWDPPPLPKVNRQTFPSINITFPRTTCAGGKNWGNELALQCVILPNFQGAVHIKNNCLLYLQFKYKRRVYKLMQLNPRKLKQLHTKVITFHSNYHILTVWFTSLVHFIYMYFFAFSKEYLQDSGTSENIYDKFSDPKNDVV